MLLAATAYEKPTVANNNQQFTIVIFGASGDLSRRKLTPALFHLHSIGALPERCRFIAFARSEYDDQTYRKLLFDVASDSYGADATKWVEFAKEIRYITGSSNDLESLRHLDEMIKSDTAGQLEDNRLYYLALSPTLYEGTISALSEAGMLDERQGVRRLVVEKPFGTDLESARILNENIHARAAENQLFRIDHYLGKDTVQNLIVFRFGNTIFEPLWNRNYIDHVQISVLEDLDVGDRAAYYEHSGVLRDMFQSHILQLLALVAMEPPATNDADSLRDEKAKVLSATRKPNPQQAAENSIRGQYNGYRELDGVSPASATATYAALRLYVDNWRWQGVPFFLRSGKALRRKYTEIAIQFRQPPHRIFDVEDASGLVPNKLRIVVQPDEAIHLTIDNKRPGPELRPQAQELSYEFPMGMRDAYERLLLDAVAGDASLFTRADEIELSWAVIDPYVNAWETELASQLYPYAQGTWGPIAADQFIAPGRYWSNPIG